jgi:hypothetical protein
LRTIRGKELAIELEGSPTQHGKSSIRPDEIEAFSWFNGNLMPYARGKVDFEVSYSADFDDVRR